MFDAEAVAIDKDSGKLMPFQELSRRKRKDVRVEDIQVRVCLFAFDLLYLNGEVRPFSCIQSCDLHVSGDSRSCTSLSWSGDSYCASTSRRCRASLTSRSPLMARRRRRSRRSWRRA